LEDDEEEARAFPEWKEQVKSPPAALDGVRRWTERNIQGGLPEPTKRRLEKMIVATSFNPDFYVKEVQFHGDLVRLVLKNVQVPMVESPAAEKATYVLIHGTTIRGATDIMASRAVKSRSWAEGGAGSHGVYGRASATVSTPETLRLVEALRSHNKNQSGIFYELRAHVGFSSIKQGGIKAEAQMCRRGCITSYPSEGRWCVPAELSALWACWVAPNALDEALFG
jgi:hypothetical protein